MRAVLSEGHEVGALHVIAESRSSLRESADRKKGSGTRGLKA